MHALYAAFVLSLAVLLWTVFAVTRYVRRHTTARGRQAKIAKESVAAGSQKEHREKAS